MTNQRLSDDEILRKAIEFDAAVIRLMQGDHERMPYVWKWPRHCCDSDFVFMFLFYVGCRGIVKVRGEASGVLAMDGVPIDDERHVWAVVNDGLIVDITAHQFDGVSEPIVKRDSEWHRAIPVLESRYWAKGSEDDWYKQSFDNRRSPRVGQMFLKILQAAGWNESST